MRSWMLCFAGVVALFLLQLFPYTGIFLMFTGAAFWSAILINVGFILLIVDVVRRRIPRWAIIFPALWFGGYLVAATVSHMKLDGFNRRIAQQNADNRVLWDKHDQDVAFPPSMAMGAGDVMTAENLVTTYDIDKAYALADPLSRGDTRGWLISLAPSSCPEDWLKQMKPQASTTSLPPLGLGRNWCETRSREDPSRPVVQIRPERITTAQGLLEIRSQKAEIVTPDGKRYEIISATARPLRWFPLPVIGCMLIDEPSSWKCFARFSYVAPKWKSMFAPDRQQPLDVVAQALGLSKRKPITARSGY